MIDTSSPEFCIGAIMSAVPYQVLASIFDRETLRREKFFETVDEYMEFVDRIDSEILEADEDAKFMFASLAVRIIILVLQSHNLEEENYGKSALFFKRVKTFVSGSLLDTIKSLERKYDVIVPYQAPRGWSCSICMSRSESHLCYKTKCEHYFHYGCYYALHSESCPLCRQTM
jgi:hypothetical protein